MTSVRELYEQVLADATEPVGGEAGMSSDVAWAVSARARTPALDPLQGGELILLPPAAVDWLGGEGMFASLIAGFRQAGASAVCVWFRPDAARAAAEINKLPLLFVANLSPTELERVVVTHIAGSSAVGSPSRLSGRRTYSTR
ncbi:MAG: hypothetical protein WKH64_17405 [Chloroflexia bacterium]